MKRDESANSVDATGGPVGWYVSRVVRFPGRRLEVLRGVLTADGTTLRLEDRVERPGDSADAVSYPATLCFPGLMATKIKVEMVVSRHANGLAELGIRPTARVPQRRVGAERYFDAAWAVLDALAGEAATVGVSSRRVAGRQVAGSRKAARAS